MYGITDYAVEIYYASVKIMQTNPRYPVRQAIADSWPNKMDDTCARKEWGWIPL